MTQQYGGFKVTVDGDDYINDVFTSIQVTGRENGISSAQLGFASRKGIDPIMWFDDYTTFDTVKIYIEYYGSYVQLFEGTIREPNVSLTQNGAIGYYKCKGVGAALEDTHCKDQFGYTSNQDSLNTIEEILEDLVDNSINKSYSSANTTGYAITKTYIPTIDAALSIPFFNAPYQTNKSIIDLLCTLDTAYRDGSTAGPHYFVDVDGNLRVKTIGTSQAEIGGDGAGTWGTYYHGDGAAVTLTEGIDFLTYGFTKPTDAYANSVVLACDLRKPAYDYWTEDSGGASLWGSTGLTSLSDTSAAGEYIVGSHSLELNVQFPDTSGRAYYPSAEDAAWDITTWGSEESIPTVSFYFMKTADFQEASSELRMCTTDNNNDFFYMLFSDVTDPDDEWIHRTIPIGNYYRMTDESRYNRWSSSGVPSWFTINCITFRCTPDVNQDASLFIDDLHFTGKIVREAVDTSEVTSYKEHQHVILSRTPLDDTAIDSDDTGMAGQLCYSELLRRVNIPTNMTCTVQLQPYLKPGEYYSIYAGLDSDGTYQVNGVDYRVMKYTHQIVTQGCTTQLWMTSDVKNSFPLSSVEGRRVLNEYLLENNEKATDMKGGDVDLLISHLRKTY